MRRLLPRLTSLLPRRGSKGLSTYIEELLFQQAVQARTAALDRLHDERLNDMLVDACRAGQLNTARALLEAGADPNWRVFEDHSPLLYAASNCDVDIIRLLLEYGADTNTKNGHLSPLAVAVFNQTVAGSVQAVACQLLINAGAKPELRCGSDSSLLHHVNNAETALVLVAGGADLNGEAERELWGSPLDLALASERLDVALALIDCGADLSKGNTSFAGRADLSKHHRVCHQFNAPIHMAAIAGDTAAVAEQLSRGVDPSTPNRLGLFALDLAGNAEIVQLLVEHGADLNYVHADGNTALHHLTNYDAVVRAIELGADVFAVNNEGRTPDHVPVCPRAWTTAIEEARLSAALIISAQRKAELASIAKRGHAQEPLRPRCKKCEILRTRKLAKTSIPHSLNVSHYYIQT